MSKKFRNLLFGFFVLIFLILSPLVLLYAFGYHFDLGKLRLQKTGIFIIKTEPSGAKILLNDQSQTNFWQVLDEKNFYVKTPARLKNLAPADYTVRLELPGYWPWEKKLPIKPNEATYAEAIRLFKKSLPILLTDQPMDQLTDAALSPDRQYLAWLTDNQVILYDLTKQAKFVLYTSQPTSSRTGLNSKTIIWSPDSRAFLIGDRIFFIDQTVRNLAEEINTAVSRVSWDKNSQTIFFLDSNGLHSYSLNDRQTANLVSATALNLGSAKLTDYQIKGNQLFVAATSPDNNSTLGIIRLDTGKTLAKLTMPIAADYNFLLTDSSLINIYDAKHKKLYLLALSANNYQLGEIKNNLTVSHWVPNNRLLYANSFEIWYSHQAGTDDTLLTRLSEPIFEVLWHPSNNYILYSTARTINSLELDDRDHHNTIELVNLNQVKNLMMSADGKTLYFFGQIGSQSGLYSLEI